MEKFCLFLLPIRFHENVWNEASGVSDCISFMDFSKLRNWNEKQKLQSSLSTNWKGMGHLNKDCFFIPFGSVSCNNRWSLISFRYFFFLLFSFIASVLLVVLISYFFLIANVMNISKRYLLGWTSLDVYSIWMWTL